MSEKKNPTYEKLLKDREVLNEISRHQWIESEKVGHDVGFEDASIDWLENFSKAWMKYHMPDSSKKDAKKGTSKGSAATSSKKTRKSK